ncbi:hypothetical protein ACFFRR_001130 [Megaselia abdita]
MESSTIKISTASLEGGEANQATSLPVSLEGGDTGSRATSLPATSLRGGEGGAIATSLSVEDDLLKSDDEVPPDIAPSVPSGGQSSSKELATDKTSTPRTNDASKSNPFKERPNNRTVKVASKRHTRREDLRHANFFLRKYEESIAIGRELTPTDLDHREHKPRQLQ